MKILIIDHSLNFITDIARYWQNLGANVDILLYSTDKISLFDHAKTSIINRIKRIKINYLRNKYDIIWFEWAPDYYFTSLKPSKALVYLRIHSPLISYIDRIDFSRFSNVIAVSKTAQKNLTHRTTTKIVPNAIDEIFFDNLYQRKFNKINICSVGRFSNGIKNFYDLFLKVKKLRDQLNIDFHLTLIGGGSNVIKKILIQKSEEFEWLQLVDYIDNREKLIQEYRKYDIFISNSIYESFGVSIVEAGTQGVIPLQYDANIQHGILPDERYYFSNYEDLVSKIKYLQNLSQGEYEKMIKELHQYISKYHPKFVADELFSDFKKSLQGE